ncbi:MAG: hypothetical protein QNJ32_13365 [Xenococcaceae cyanobacterium MO_167.B27]|nr:hypothetical protein [Xenococcaceae cyanobacterium MO_167.B27]
MLANSSSPEDRAVPDKQTLNLKSSFDDSNIDVEDSPSRLLPRSAWNSKVAFFRAIFKAKKTLDKIEFLYNNKH